MRYILLFVTMLTLAQAQIDKKWSSNKNCEACHQNISHYWETSRHANSHESKNDLFRKSLEYMVAKNPKLTLDEAKVECAQCHNPRIGRENINNNEKMLLALDIDETKNQFQHIFNDEHMKNGINCIVCHNIDEIHLDKTQGSKGLQSVKFGKQGTMFGPFENTQSPYHKTEQRPHFADNSPELCFVCHYGAKNKHGLEVYATGVEYESVSTPENQEGCRECHMGPTREGFASNYSRAGEQPIPRMVRDHRFASLDGSADILEKHIIVSNSIDFDRLSITLKNNAPHSMPTGYGLREIILGVTFYDESGKALDHETQTLSIKWKDKNGELTIPHLAKEKTSDTRLPAKSEQVYYFNIPYGSSHVIYTVNYKLINSYMAKEIGVTDPFFLKEYKVKEGKIILK